MQTATEWLWEQIDGIIPYQDINTSQLFIGLLEQAKEMEKQQIIDAREDGIKDAIWFNSEMELGRNGEPKMSEQYYNETYGSKGSDETNGNNVEEVPNVVEDVFNQELFNYFSQEFNINLLNTEMHDIIDIVKNITSSQTEISDEEMLEEAKKHSELYQNKFASRNAFIMGCKWYREQLKKKQ